MKPPKRHGHHPLGTVADTFLPRSGSTLPPLYAAAPGVADTSSVLNVLRPNADEKAVKDLGGAVGVRLGRMERTGGVAVGDWDAPQLVWCPCGNEALTMATALALGRLGALITPARALVLWFAGGVSRIGRDPSLDQRRWAKQMADAALPQAVVSLYCLGWKDDAARQLADLAGRFH